MKNKISINMNISTQSNKTHKPKTNNKINKK